MKLIFEWNEAKAEENLRKPLKWFSGKRGLSFT